MSYLTLKDINKIYPNGYHAVHNFNLEIDKGEFIVFVGPSGCGKSTTLRMIAGLEDISGGEFPFGGNTLDLSRKLGARVKNYEGKELVFGFRPEAIVLGKAENAYQVAAEVELTEMLGDNTNVYITAGEDKAILKVDPHDTPEVDSSITFSIPYENVYLFDGKTEKII